MTAGQGMDMEDVITKCEVFNGNKAYHLVDTFNVEMLSPARRAGGKESIEELRKYVKSSVQEGVQMSVSVYYKQMRYKDKPKGRLYVRPVGMQTLLREIRDTILMQDDGTPMVYDVDIVNCMPTLVEQWIRSCTTLHLDVSAIREYIEHRDDKLEEMVATMSEIPDKRSAKQHVIKVAFGHAQIGKRPTMWLQQWAMLMSTCATMVGGMRAYADIKESKLSRSHNVHSSVFAIVMFDLENTCMMAAHDYFERETKFSPMSLIFDGFLLKAVPGIARIPQEMLDACSNHVYEKTTFRVTFAQKALDNGLALPGYNPPVRRPPDLVFVKRYRVENDHDGGLAMLDLFGKHVAYDGDVFYTKEDGLWTEIREMWKIKSYFHMRVADAPLYKIDKDMEERNDIFKNVSKQRSITDAAVHELMKHRDPDFRAKLSRSSRGKLLFRNGYLDLRQDSTKLLPVSDEVLFEHRIECDYTPEENEWDHEIERRIFLPIFGDTEEGRANAMCWKTYVCRGFACEIGEKRWAIMCGKRNCGKGVLCDSLRQAFGKYTGSFSANNMKADKSSKGQDFDLALSFAKDFDKRGLVFSNELNIVKGHNQMLDGNLVKMLTSGGDMVNIRALYGMPREVVPMARMLICANDIPDINPKDAMSTLIVFEIDAEFVESLDDRMRMCNERGSMRYQIRDPVIKRFIKEPEYQVAFIRHIIKAYVPHDRYISPGVSASSVKVQGDEDNSKEFLECFISTGNDCDRVLMKEVKQLISERFYGMSQETASQALKTIGGVYKQSSNAKLDKETRKTGFRGVILKEDDEVYR